MSETPQSSDIRPVVRETVLEAAVTPAVPVTAVEGRVITMAPGTIGGPHVHNCPVVGTIVSGSVTFGVAGGPRRVLGVGDTFYEPAEVVIDAFDALTDGVVFHAWYLLADGQTPELRPVDD